MPLRTQIASAVKMLVVAASLAAGAVAHAQSWPTRPLRFIVPEAPSVPQDIISRGLVEPLGKALGQPIIVENRIGADGMIGNEACARTPADGYTMCATASKDIVWNPVLRTKLPYDVLRDFTPVIHTGFFDSVLVVNPQVPVKRVSELFEYSKANPGKVNWGHFGVNSTGYMYMEWMNRNRGTAFYPVPYKTPITNTQGLMSGETSVAVTSISNSIGFIKGGKLRPLAVTMSKRLDALPDVPTFEEEGIKLPLRTWFGYHYQAGVPRELVNRMNTELHHVLDAPAFRAQILDRQYVTPNTGTPEQFDAFIREQQRVVRELVASIGIKPED